MKYNVFTEVFNPSRGMVVCFLGSVYTDDLAEARRLARGWFEPGEKRIFRRA